MLVSEEQIDNPLHHSIKAKAQGKALRRAF